MSGGPPHHPHGRQVPAANTAWNHLQALHFLGRPKIEVPNYFPRQPQHAHMSNEHSILHPHQPAATWHTPTTNETIKPLPHSNLFPVCFPRNAPGVDLSLTRNGSQNGELPTTPISLSVRDTNKINSLPASVLEIQAVELTKCASPSLKSVSPGVEAGKPQQKRSNIRVDSILERLNPNVEKNTSLLDKSVEAHSVIVPPADENSNSSSILNVPTPTNVREEDTVSTNSNEDSLDSTKSRRKRKPSKTVRVSKDDGDVPSPPEAAAKPDGLCFVSQILEEKTVVGRRRSSDDIDSLMPAKTRRKTSSESETIDNIAAMVQECVKDKNSAAVAVTVEEVAEPEPKKSATPTQFVEVENKLEEMFAGIEDKTEPSKAVVEDKMSVKPEEDPLLKLVEPDKEPAEAVEKAEDNKVAEVMTVLAENEPTKKAKRKSKSVSRRNSDISSTETTPKKKKTSKKLKKEVKPLKVTPKSGGKGKKVNGKQNASKVDAMKEVYAYDSGSNASSSKSRGPFIQIKGPRDSPISVSVVNTPLNDEDSDKKTNKLKKYHDDSEYRHKVRNRGLHCSTLSNKYDAQTKDTTWICAFCKRGPHATELSGPSYNGEVTAAGDLFGPYLISTDSPAFAARLDDPYDRQFKSKKIGKVLDESAVKVGKKGRKKHSDAQDDVADLYLGITDTGNKTYEIWAHEDCIVWSPGIYLVGAKIVGLEEAIWTSCNVKCKVCNLKGANICCIKRGCLSMAHVCCARTANWQFDADNFKVYCPVHTTQ